MAIGSIWRSTAAGRNNSLEKVVPSYYEEDSMRD